MNSGRAGNFPTEGVKKQSISFASPHNFQTLDQIRGALFFRHWV
jgi:hypothetical protein